MEEQKILGRFVSNLPDASQHSLAEVWASPSAQVDETRAVAAVVFPVSKDEICTLLPENNDRLY